MKRLLSSILILVYFVTSSGFTVNLHYCMDRFDTISLGSSDKECGVCGMKNGESNCCHDETLRIKSGDDHATVSSLFVHPPAEAPCLPVYSFINEIEGKGITSFPYSAHAPPILNDRQSLYCTWRI